MPYPLTQVVRDLTEALRRRSFHDRIASHLATRYPVERSTPDSDAG